MAKDYKQAKKGKPPFVQIFHWMMATEAWETLPPGPKVLYIELKKRYKGHNNGGIFLSHRDAARACNVHRNTIGGWFKTLEERGFIVMTKGPHLGPSGVGIAATWALTEYPTEDGKRGTMMFKKWKSPAQNECIAGHKSVHRKQYSTSKHKNCDGLSM